MWTSGKLCSNQWSRKCGKLRWLDSVGLAPLSWISLSQASHPDIWWKRLVRRRGHCMNVYIMYPVLKSTSLHWGHRSPSTWSICSLDLGEIVILRIFANISASIQALWLVLLTYFSVFNNDCPQNSEPRSWTTIITVYKHDVCLCTMRCFLSGRFRLRKPSASEKNHPWRQHVTFFPK